MTKLTIFVALTIGSWIGWWLGSFYSLGWAFALSCVGSFAGIVAGWKVATEYLEQ